jgi:hypothetical protein
MNSFLRSSRFEITLSLIVVSLATFLTYGLLIPHLGFYRDDWYLIWTARSLGPDGILSLFQGDRPLLGWLYVLDYRLLGASPLGWHAYALVLRWLGALAFWSLLRTIWPEKRIQTTVATLLFVVYPGFYQQPNAATFKNLLLAYAAAMLSLTLSLRAVKAHVRTLRYGLVLGALLSAAFYLYIYEALIGLEAARLILLWYMLRQPEARDLKADLRHTLRLALPYLLLGIGFLYWRIFLFSSTRRATSVDLLVGGYSAAPMHAFLQVAIESVKDWIETAVFAWSVPFYQFAGQFRYRDVLAAAGVALVVLLIVAVYLKVSGSDRRVSESADQDEEPHWIWLGAVIVVLTSAPIILAGRNVLFAVQWDRYTFQSLLGVALLLAGIAFHALRGFPRRVFIFGLIGLGVMTQYFSAAYYRDFWAAERELWWQLAWRAPAIQAGTTVIASAPGTYQLAEEYEVWGPLNLLYHPGQPLTLAGQISYGQLLVDLERGTLEERLVRGTVTVERDFNKALIVSMPAASGCLHVFDGRQPYLSLAEGKDIVLIAPYSQIELIQTGAPAVDPPAEIFGREPEHDWCFYYQKIGLALQMGQWAKAAQLADESISKDLRPLESSEWMPVVTAYANNGQLKEARQASKYINDRYTRVYLCQQLRAMQSPPAGYQVDTILSLMCDPKE